jgi:hypothetical protein
MAAGKATRETAKESANSKAKDEKKFRLLIFNLLVLFILSYSPIMNNEYDSRFTFNIFASTIKHAKKYPYTNIKSYNIRIKKAI